MLARIDSRFLEMVKRQRAALATGIACSGLSSLFDLLSIGFIYWTVGAVERGDSRSLGMLCIGVVATYAVKYFFTFGQSYFLSKAAQATTERLRGKLFEKLHALPLSFFNQARVGALQSVITNDVTVVQNGIGIVRDAINGPLLVVGGMATLFLLNWKLTLVALIGLPPVLWAIRATSKRVRAAQAEVQEEMAAMSTVMQESLSGVRIVKSFGAEDREVKRFSKQLARNFESNMKLVRRIARLKPTTELIGACALAGTIWVGGILVAAGEMRIADLLTFGFTLDKIKNGASGLGNLNNVYNQIAAAVERIYREVLDVDVGIAASPHSRTLEQPRGRIAFEDVTFSYPDGTRALDRVSFVIEPGTSVALVGRSGAGKSTITDLVLRFYDPSDGRITFDGVDLRELDPIWLRRQMGVVPQQTLLFAGSVEENISYGRPDADHEAVVAAACQAHAHEFIQSLDAGYNAEVGERGTRLSGGEMQRIAIARALLVDPKLLILDEATSNLDPESEQRVQQALDEVMATRTTLLIAHRLNTAARANIVIVLSQGRIVESGSHAELVAAGGTYAGMVKAFAAGVFDGSLD